jgi:eukaryotic-like serine/threonine-protein kinase
VDPLHLNPENVLVVALTLAPGGPREAYLRKTCGDNAGLRADVEALLQAHAAAGGSLEPPHPHESLRVSSEHAAAATIVSPARTAIESPGQMIGRYKLLQLIGEGGFGSVWMAEQKEPVKRRVALKIIKLGMDTKQVVARFEAERQALAMMDHPNIARVLDAGATETGRPFFVMELVRGVPILEYCDTEKLDTAKRLELFVDVCNAIQHAHQKGIIHRDIKPSNILVTLHDGKPVPKVIDFGIAKATSSELTDKTLFTQHRQMIGTPAYMSPEQAEMSGLDIDTRSDIYSLGVLLYELLTGTTPFSNDELMSKGFAEMMRIIRDVEPHKPSTRLSTMGETITRTAQLRHAEPGKLRSILKGDLDWIVMKCLEKDRQRRYDTANGLGMDIQRHLAGEAVLAAPPSRVYRLRKGIRRNKAAFTAAAVVGVALMLGVVGTTWGMVNALQQREIARGAQRAESQQRQDAERAREAEAAQRLRAQESERRAIEAAALAQREAERAEAEAQLALEAQAREQARAEELEQVAEFQAGQLSEIDPSLMGVRMRASIMEKRRAALAGRGRDAQEIEAAVQELDQSLQGVNFTNIALETLEENIFDRALKVIDENFNEQPLIRAYLLQTVANTLRSLGLLHRAADPQARAHEIRRRILGDEHQITLVSIYGMGVLLSEQGRSAEAEPYHREALEKGRRIFGEEHSNTLTSIQSVGLLLQAQGKLDEAELYLREALEKRRRVLGEEHPDTLKSIGALGVLLVHQGRYAEAEPYLRQALELRRRVLGEEHPSTIAAIGNMANLLWSQGRRAEAEPYLREGLEKSRRVRGDEHPTTLTGVSNMGVLLRDEGKLAEAEAYDREALKTRRRTLGDEHPDTLSSIHNMGVLLRHLGRYTEAEVYLSEALETRRRVLGDEHPDTLSTVNSMGVLLSSQGKLAEAEPYQRQALEIHRRTRGNDHPDTLHSMHNVGVLLHDQKKRDEAEAYYREALEGRRRTLGDDHPDTLASVISMGVLLRGMGRLAEAEPYLREALEGQRRILGDEHPDTLTSINNMGVVLHNHGKPDEAVAYFREVMEIRRRVQGDEHSDTLEAISNMGFLLWNTGRLAEAEPYYRELLETRRRTMGDEHPTTLESIHAVGVLLGEQGKFAEAEAYCREVLEIRRRTMGETHPDTAGSMAVLGLCLLQQNTAEKAVEAEPLLRELLEIRTEILAADDWLLANTRSLLGGALLIQGRALLPTDPAAAKARLIEARPLLEEGYERMNPPPEVAFRKAEALQRVIDLFEALHTAEPDNGHDAQAQAWRARQAQSGTEGTSENQP